MFRHVPCNRTNSDDFRVGTHWNAPEQTGIRPAKNRPKSGCKEHDGTGWFRPGKNDLGYPEAIARMPLPQLWSVLFFLMMIVLMPFSTAFLSTNIGQLVPSVFYNVSLALTAFGNLAVIMIATDAARGHSRHKPNDARTIRLRAQVVLAAAIVCVGLAFLAPKLSQIPMAGLLLLDRFIRSRSVSPA